MIITLNLKPNFFKGLGSFSKVKIDHKLKTKIAKPYTKNHNLTIMTENAVHLAIKHVLPRNSARPKSSALFYERLNTYVSPSDSAHLQLQQLVIHFQRGLHHKITS